MSVHLLCKVYVHFYVFDVDTRQPQQLCIGVCVEDITFHLIAFGNDVEMDAFEKIIHFDASFYLVYYHNGIVLMW